MSPHAHPGGGPPARPATTHRPRFPGSPFPLGAHPTAHGTQFAVHAPDATGVEVCLVGDDGTEQRVALEAPTYGIWHGVIPDVGPGQRYGYRAHGPWDPRRGLRFNPEKLLVDPWARRLSGGIDDYEALTSSADGNPFGPPSPIDSLGHLPYSVVTALTDPVPGPRAETPWEETVIYELHVGSYTARHPLVPPELRGTYLGLAQPCILDHLTALGVTAVELLPVHAYVTERSVAARGMRNHWGYATASYFAPHPGYAARPGGEIAEFRTMVDALHGAGIEVILDVVYNHTCEEGLGGITLGWRGLDGPGYYLLDDEGRDIDVTGCGNTVNANSPIAVRMITDSLRHWALNMGVDGFRFDLASALGRVDGGPFDPAAPVLSAVAADPVLSRCKLIAEPWDATAAGYQLGRFGLQWSEWNDRYRDVLRTFWNGTSGVGELASRVAGSEDLFRGRRPWASVNFVTAHDGFTVADLVSYRHKHNEANGEQNRDGTGHNHSVDHGVEGPTDDLEILAARDRHVRNLLASLTLSTGTPMLLAGDEFGHTLGGNNNAYCVPAGTPREDAWPLDWESADPARTAFVTHALALRRAAPALRQPEFFEGRSTPTGHPDLVWFGRTGAELDDSAWFDESQRTLQAWIDCSDVRSHTAEGQMLTDDSWLVIAHADGPADVTLGCPEWFYGTLRLELDTRAPDGVPEPGPPIERGTPLHLDGPSFLVLRATD
ncbi:glycogen debranching protein GlgX [Rhodococcus triatomae]|uniref:Glycogen operon protein n=1 Tax=Rhodococcus triatomae TaxID=300028 RepID=A0A1G8EUQ1_9NOCA|nr:glycogen debranching protein GlgX [Rhodococcus triatomae]QNG19299.1 glycogen debranching protein GlgX [Rhodococcus triatomae]QNG24788.1 glycogen debranching protein GlgX [Rhodococcus triatomae]SDH73631.1 glycogen operon protein [Rhodococcus triatomae]